MKYETILQIDDDAEDCDLFFEVLQTVSPAKYIAMHNAVEALKKLESKDIAPDVIFLDLNMPKMNGVEFLSEIKKREALKDIPVIVFSTSPVIDMKQQTLGLGVHDYITKPHDYNAFKVLLQSKV